MEQDHPVVLFDGECALCNRSVNFLLKVDRNDVFRFATLPSASRTSGDVPGSVVLSENGHMYTRSEAVIRIFRRLGFPFSIALVFRLIPRGLRDAAYDWIARNRYRWFGRQDTCRLPKPEERHKFI